MRKLLPFSQEGGRAPVVIYLSTSMIVCMGNELQFFQSLSAPDEGERRLNLELPEALWRVTAEASYG
jgi:hypothetical protein